MRVIITGGSGRQFSSDIVNYFLEKNCFITIFTRSRKRAELNLADKLLKYEEKLRIQEVDYNDLDSLRKAVSETAITLNGVDALINSAATAKLGSLEDFDLAKWNSVLHLNLTVPLYLSLICAPYLKVSENGSILNVSSIYGLRSPKHFIYEDSGLNSPVNYGASKAALQYITKYLSSYWGSKIRVNCISPGGYFNDQPNNFVNNYVRNVPLGRMAKEGDLGGAAYFLCSPDARYITGHNLVVDGGWSNW